MKILLRKTIHSRRKLKEINIPPLARAQTPYQSPHVRTRHEGHCCCGGKNLGICSKRGLDTWELRKWEKSVFSSVVVVVAVIKSLTTGREVESKKLNYPQFLFRISFTEMYIKFINYLMYISWRPTSGALLWRATRQRIECYSLCTTQEDWNTIQV